MFTFLYSKYKKFHKIFRNLLKGRCYVLHSNACRGLYCGPARGEGEGLRIRAHLSNQPQLVTDRRLPVMKGSRRTHNIISTAPLHCGSELCVMYREQKQLSVTRMRCLSHASKDRINKEMLTLGTNLIRTV